MWNLITTRVTQFDYFDRLLEHPAWKGSRVLDFGGNIGTFLVAQETMWTMESTCASI